MCHIALTAKLSTETKNKIMNLADEMAAASAERSAQSYDNLMRARRLLESELNNDAELSY